MVKFRFSPAATLRLLALLTVSQVLWMAALNAPARADDVTVTEDAGGDTGLTGDAADEETPPASDGIGCGEDAEQSRC